MYADYMFDYFVRPDRFGRVTYGRAYWSTSRAGRSPIASVTSRATHDRI